MAVTAWTAGTRVTADKLNEMLPRWSSWTPTWTTSTGVNTPAFGNATISCEYCQTGDLVVARFEVIMGSTTTYGGGTTSDNWRFSLPVDGDTSQTGIGWFELNYSTTVRLVARARMTTSSVFELEVSSGRVDGTAATNAGLVDLSTPETWASGDAIRGTLSYHAA